MGLTGYEAQLAGASEKIARARFAPTRQTIPDPTVSLVAQTIQPHMAQPAHHGLLLCPHEPPGTWNRPSRRVQLFADHSTVLRTPLTNASISCSRRASGLLPTGLVFHQPFSEPPSPPTSIPPWARRGEHLSIPPLQGRLTLVYFANEDLLEYMITVTMDP